MADFWQQVRDEAAKAAREAVEAAFAARDAAQTGAGYTQPPAGQPPAAQAPAASSGDGSVFVAALGRTLPAPTTGETMPDYAKRAADALAAGDPGIAAFYRNAAGMLADSGMWQYGADQRTWPDVLGRWSRMLIAPAEAAATAKPGGVDAAGGLHSRIDVEQPRGAPGTQWFPNFGGVNLPVGQPGEGSASYVERVAGILAKGDQAKQWQLVNSRGPLAIGMGGSYGFTGDPASYPQGAVNFAEQIFATPAAGTVPGGIPQGATQPATQDVQIG